MLRYRRKNTVKIRFTVYRQKRYRQKRENRLPPKTSPSCCVTVPSKSVKNIVTEHLPGKNEGTLHVTGIKQQVLYAEKEAKHENCGRKERVKNLNSRGVAEIFQRTNRKQAEGKNA